MNHWHDHKVLVDKDATDDKDEADNSSVVELALHPAEVGAPRDEKDGPHSHRAQVAQNCASSSSGSEGIMSADEIQSRLDKFADRVDAFASTEFDGGQDDKYFVVVYGSYAYGMAKPSSDLDIMFVAQKVNTERRQRVTDFVIGIQTFH